MRKSKLMLFVLVVVFLLAMTLPAAAASPAGAPSTAVICARYVTIIVKGVPIKLCITKPRPTLRLAG